MANVNMWNSAVTSGFGVHHSEISHHGNARLAVNRDLNEDTLFSKWNISVALNLIPLIGSIIAGVMHIKMGLEQRSQEQGEGRFLIARGVAEIVAGPVVATIDIIISIGRIVAALKGQSTPGYETIPAATEE